MLDNNVTILKMDLEIVTKQKTKLLIKQKELAKEVHCLKDENEQLTQ